MMELKVIGGGCDECDRLYENVSEALKQLEMSAQIERVSELIDIVKLGVMTAPSLMKDGKLIVSGQVPSVEKLMELRKKYPHMPHICGCEEKQSTDKRRRNSMNEKKNTQATVGESVGFERIRRITGYLVGTTDRFNNAKRAEEKDRVKHGLQAEN